MLAQNIRPRMTKPIQKAEKLPATKPDRMFSEAPPCLEQMVTSLTCCELVLVKTLVNSGITAPAMVPQEMMADRTHQRLGSMPGCLASSSQLAPRVTAMETSEVIQTRWVSGSSKSKSFFPVYFTRVMASFKRYEASEVTIMRARMVNSQMMRVAHTEGLAFRASARNVIR